MITTTFDLGIALPSTLKPLDRWAEEYVDRLRNSGRVGFVAFTLCDDGFGRYYSVSYSPNLQYVEQATVIYPVF